MGNIVLILAKCTQVNFFKKAKESGKPQLISIPFSHFVEFARWSWELAQKKFDENSYLPGQHVLPVLALRVGGTEKHISSSSFMIGVERNPETINEKNAAKARSTAVPVLILPSGEVLSDSWSIANQSGLKDITDRSLIKMYDEELGPLARQFAYCSLLKTRNRSSWDRLLCHKQGWLWKIAYYFFGNFIHKKMSKSFGIGKPHLVIEMENKIERLFDRIAKERLLPREQNHYRYINGNIISVEDVALCSLAAAICFPAKYCNGEFSQYFSKMEADDAEFRGKIEYYRNTEVGKYVMQFYEDHR